MFVVHESLDSYFMSKLSSFMGLGNNIKWNNEPTDYSTVGHLPSKVVVHKHQILTRIITDIKCLKVMTYEASLKIAC